MPIDIKAERAATPACAQAINLNTASSGFMSTHVAARMARHGEDVLRLGHARARDAVRAELHHVRAITARLLDVMADEIAFTDTATRAWAMAFHAAVPLRPGDRILMAQGDWAGNRLNAQHAANQQGADLITLGNGADGTIDRTELDRLLTPACRAVCLSLLPTSGGVVQPAAEIARDIRRRAPECLIFLDASQAAGQIPLSLPTLGADVVVFPARKWLRGPDGVAVLAIRRAALVRCTPGILLDREGFELAGETLRPNTPDARRFEGHSFDVAGRLGLGVAVEHTLVLGLERIAARVESLAARLRAGIAAIPGINPQDHRQARAGIVTCSFDHLTPAQVMRELATQDVLAGLSDHRYAEWDLRARGLPVVLRLSPHYITTEAEIDRAVSLLGCLAADQAAAG